MILLFLTTFLKTYLQLFNQLFWCRSLCFRHRALFLVWQECKYQDLTWLSSIPYWSKENVSWRRFQEMIFKQRGRLCRIGGCRSTVVSCNPALFNVDVRPTTSLSTVSNSMMIMIVITMTIMMTMIFIIMMLVECWGKADNKPPNINTWNNFKTSSSQLWSNSK